MERTPITRLLLAFVLALCLGAPLVSADELPETSGAFHAISVRDLDKTTAWYVEVLGFEVTSEGGNEHRKGALLERQGTVLELAQFEGAVAREDLREGLESHQVFGLFKLGFTTANLDETFAYLEQKGAEVFFPIVEASDGKRTFGIKDPEGNILQFFGE